MLLSQIGVVFFNVAFLSPILGQFKGSISKILYILIGVLEIYIYLTYKPTNFYEEYKITRKFDQSQLRQAYKRIMLDYHPDRNTQITSEQFNYLKNINEILKQDEPRQQYDQFGVVVESNINPLPAIIYRIKLTRLFFYMILFLIQLVNSQDQKSQQKLLTILVLGLGYGDFFLMEQPQYFQNSHFFASLALFEFLNIYRIVVTLIISCILAEIKNQQIKRNQLLELLDQRTIQEIVLEHKEFLNTQNSIRQKILNGFLMVALTIYLFSNSVDYQALFLKALNYIQMRGQQDL
ncbi:unnamed protein product (macronuclear) [Paramecium tetraurelia]|uniref:J domain-containing protein n=1 Tax=Paramecium tetraurelia TaxID=5888 RepID=A0C725_PARTE|nr:uncharacterized protein GSPATT00035722001 [Paramecium tetraurelia]CAK66592.1 unnamed protein product [Paramecium tetraurelia]|eukprot:XP_001433989.1 hypothetical protein (macronuclear) [Paramecium tetraurelia strain d4-2]